MGHPRPARRRGARRDRRAGRGKPGRPGGARPRHGQAGPARSHRAGQARTAANDAKVDSRGRPGSARWPSTRGRKRALAGRATGTRVVEGLTISNGPRSTSPAAALPRPTQPSTSSTSRPGPGPASSSVAAASSMTVGSRSGPTARPSTTTASAVRARAGRSRPPLPPQRRAGRRVRCRRRTTSVAFVGDSGDLYITTSWVDSERRADEPLGAVFRCRPVSLGRLAALQEPPRATEKGVTRDRAHRHLRGIRRSDPPAADAGLAQLAEESPAAAQGRRLRHDEWSTEDFREHIAGGLNEHAPVSPATRDALVGMLSYLPADVTEPEDVRRVVGDDTRTRSSISPCRPACSTTVLSALADGGPGRHRRGGDREAVRLRPRVGAAPQRDPAHPDAAPDRLPHRPLPVRRPGPPGHRAPLRQPGLRADLERGPGRAGGHQLDGEPRARGPRLLLRRGRRAQGHGAEPPDGGHGAGAHGRAGPLRRRLDPRHAGGGAADGGDADGGVDAQRHGPRPLHAPARSGRARSRPTWTSPGSIPAATPRPTPP